MRTRPSFPLLVGLASAIIATAAGGCAWTQDERDFYGRGWVNPRDLDRPAPHRGPRPVPGEGVVDDDPTPVNPWTTGGAGGIGRRQ